MLSSRWLCDLPAAMTHLDCVQEWVTFVRRGQTEEMLAGLSSAEIERRVVL